MKSKYVAFAKNAGLAAAFGVAAGAGVAELTDLLFDNATVTAISSTVSEYLAAYAVFLPLHARDNRDVYRRQDGSFNLGSFIVDQMKLAGGFILLDIAYLTGRPYLAREALESGVNPSNASLYADAISYPVLLAAAIPLAKLTGNIRTPSAPERTDRGGRFKNKEEA